MTLYVGIDENGLGPRLGPLIVTAITARSEGPRVGKLTRAARGALAGRIGDSKKLVSFGDSVLGEAWARALSAETPLLEPRTPEQLIDQLSIDSRATLQRPCPDARMGAHMGQCWSADTEALVADASLVEVLRKDLLTLRKKGLDIQGAHVAIVCTERLNEALGRGISRFQADLHAMERLLIHIREQHGVDLDATCGKVGGYDCYPPAMGPLKARVTATLEEGRARSAYRIDGLGDIAFVRDADGGHLLVGLASIVGKWVRDLLTRRVTRYHRAHDPKLPEASGYHDPVTSAFIAASALARKERGVSDVCFERRARGVSKGKPAAPKARPALP
jgi:ribonuclease HII